MIIKRLEIVGFGKWQDKTIEFDPTFQLIHGDNEAGKSTIYQFIREILFGFPYKRQNFKDYTPKSNSLYGGRVIFEHPIQGEIMVERIKTTNRGKAHVYFKQGQVGDENTLKELLSPLTLEVFDEAFSLQQEQLLEIKNLSEQRLQNLLLAVGLSGNKRLLGTKDVLRQRQQELYKPTGRLPELNQKLTDYQELKQLVKQKEQNEKEYRKQLQAANYFEEQLAIGQEQFAESEAELQRLKQQQQLFPLYEERKQLISVTNYRQEDQVAAEKMAKAAKAYENYLFLLSQEQHYQELKNEQLLASQESPASLFYLKHEREIQALADKQSTVETALSRHRWLTEILAQREAELHQLKNQLNLPDDEENWSPDESVKVNITALAEKEKELEETLHKQELAFDQQMKALDQIQNPDPSVIGQRTRSESEPSLVQRYLTALMVAAVGLILMVIKQFPLGLLVCLIAGVIAVLISWRKVQKEHTDLPEQPARLDEQVERLAAELEVTQKLLVNITYQKVALAETYQFKETEPMTSWLFEFPLRERLVTVQKERETALVELGEVREALAENRQALRFMSEWLPVESEELGSVFRKLVEFNKDMQAKQQMVAEQDQGIHRWREPLKDVRERLAEVLAEINQLIPTIAQETIDELPILLASEEERTNQLIEVGHLTRQIQEVFDLEADYRLPDIVAKTHRQDLKVRELKTANEDTVRHLQEVTFAIRQQETDGTLSELNQQKENSESELRQLTENWMTYRVSESVMQDVLDFLATQQLPVLLATTSSYFKELTLGAYLKCQMDAGKLVVVTKAEEMLQLGELSTGTRDQLYMAIRLAFIQLHSQDQLAPVIIDDGWLHYDTHRKHRLFELLGRLSKTVQVICFTSDQELLTYANEKNYQVEQL